jgi:hypothetical protein
VTHICHSSTWEAEQEDFEFEASLGYLVSPYLKRQPKKSQLEIPIAANYVSSTVESTLLTHFYATISRWRAHATLIPTYRWLNPDGDYLKNSQPVNGQVRTWTQHFWFWTTIYSSKLGHWSFQFSTADPLFRYFYSLFVCDCSEQVALILPGFLDSRVSHYNSLEEISRRYFCLNEMNRLSWCWASAFESWVVTCNNSGISSL